MKKNSKCIAQVCRVIGLWLSLSVAAMAQSQVYVPPVPQHPVVDENGVELQTQTVSYAHAYVSIGPSDHRGLEYAQDVGLGWNSFFGLWDEEYDVTDGWDVDYVQFGSYTAAFVNGVSNEGDGSYGMDPVQTLILKDGTRITFGHATLQSDPQTTNWNNVQLTYGYWLPDSITYPDGVVVTIHYRDAPQGQDTDPRIQSVTTNTGYQLKYYYESNDPTQAGYLFLAQIVAINNAYEYCDPNADSCSVSSSWPSAQFANSYSNGVYETDITDAADGQMRWQEDSAPTYIKLQTPGNGIFNRQYTLADVADPINGGGQTIVPLTKVAQSTVDGRVTNYAFSWSGTTDTVTSTAPLGDMRRYLYPNQPANLPGLSLFAPRLTSLTNGLNATTQYQYDYFLRTTTATSPEGNSISYEYDNGRNDASYLYGYPAGNITHITKTPKPGSGQQAMSEGWGYPSCNSPGVLCGEPQTFTDFKGQTTSYTYDPTHGGLLTETLPPDSRGISPVKRFFYQQRSAYYLNSSNNYVAGSPIWVLTEQRTCLNSATVNNGCAGGDEVVTDYDYGSNGGPNNLLLRGKVVTYGDQSLRICYGYDDFGNKISETEPRAGLTSCP